MGSSSFRMRYSWTFDNIDVNGIDCNVKDKYGDTPFHFDGQSRSIPFRPFMSFSSIEKDSWSKSFDSSPKAGLSYFDWAIGNAIKLWLMRVWCVAFVCKIRIEFELLHCCKNTTRWRWQCDQCQWHLQATIVCAFSIPPTKLLHR